MRGSSAQKCTYTTYLITVTIVIVDIVRVIYYVLLTCASDVRYYVFITMHGGELITLYPVFEYRTLLPVVFRSPAPATRSFHRDPPARASRSATSASVKRLSSDMSCAHVVIIMYIIILCRTLYVLRHPRSIIRLFSFARGPNEWI